MKRRRHMVVAIRNAIRHRNPSRGGFDGWFTEEGRSLSDAEVLDRMLDALAHGKEFVGCDEPNADGSCPGHEMPEVE